MEAKAQKVLNKIRKALKCHGGDVELVSIDNKKGVVMVQLKGVCAHCPMARITLEQGVEVVLKKEVKGVKKVIAV